MNFFDENFSWTARLIANQPNVIENFSTKNEPVDMNLNLHAKFFAFVLCNENQEKKIAGSAVLIRLRKTDLSRFALLQKYMELFGNQFLKKNKNHVFVASNYLALVPESDILRNSHEILCRKSFAYKKKDKNQKNWYLLPVIMMNLDQMVIQGISQSFKDFLYPLEILKDYDVVQDVKLNNGNLIRWYHFEDSHIENVKRLINNAMYAICLLDYLMFDDKMQVLDSLSKHIIYKSEKILNEENCIEIFKILFEFLCKNSNLLHDCFARFAEIFDCLFSKYFVVNFFENVQESQDFLQAYKIFSTKLFTTSCQSFPPCVTIFLQYILSRAAWRAFPLLLSAPTMFLNVKQNLCEQSITFGDQELQCDKVCLTSNYYASEENLFNACCLLLNYFSSQDRACVVSQKDNNQTLVTASSQINEDEHYKEEIDTLWFVEQPKTCQYEENWIHQCLHSVFLSCDPIDENLWQNLPSIEREVLDDDWDARDWASASLWLVGGSLSRAMRRQRRNQDSFYSDFDLIIVAKSGRSLQLLLSKYLEHIFDYLIKRHGLIRIHRIENIVTIAVFGKPIFVSVIIVLDQTICEYIKAFDLSHAQVAYRVGSDGMERELVGTSHGWTSNLFSHGSVATFHRRAVKEERLAKLFALELPFLIHGSLPSACKTPLHTLSAKDYIETWYESLVHNLSDDIVIKQDEKRQRLEGNQNKNDFNTKKKQVEKICSQYNTYSFYTDRCFRRSFLKVQHISVLQQKLTYQAPKIIQERIFCQREMLYLAKSMLSEYDCYFKREISYSLKNKNFATHGWLHRAENILKGAQFSAKKNYGNREVITFVYSGILEKRFYLCNVYIEKKSYHEENCYISGSAIDKLINCIPVYEIFENLVNIYTNTNPNFMEKSNGILRRGKGNRLPVAKFKTKYQKYFSLLIEISEESRKELAEFLQSSQNDAVNVEILLDGYNLICDGQEDDVMIMPNLLVKRFVKSNF